MKTCHHPPLKPCRADTRKPIPPCSTKLLAQSKSRWLHEDCLTEGEAKPCHHPPLEPCRADARRRIPPCSTKLLAQSKSRWLHEDCLTEGDAKTCHHPPRNHAEPMLANPSHPYRRGIALSRGYRRILAMKTRQWISSTWAAPRREPKPAPKRKMKKQRMGVNRSNTQRKINQRKRKDTKTEETKERNK